MTRRKKTKGSKSPLIRLVGLEAAAVAAGMTCSPAMAAPGDLDPSFGDVGRQSGIGSHTIMGASGRSMCRTTTPCCSVAVASTAITAATKTISSGDCSRAGRLMQASLPLRWNGTAVYDTTLQSDGKVSASVPRGSRTA